MQVLQTVEELRAARSRLQGTVGLVPTMGALHAGHLALVKQACADNEQVIATIFVNPTQFGPEEDLNSYPRTLKHDLQLLEAEGVDVVFTPLPDVMYPAGFQTYVNVEEVTEPLEGTHRPGHFRGVTTVVAKLFNLTQPTRAYFGQKDAQQVVVIRRMVRDLNFPLDVVIVPTVREVDGLAMSSRNAYLDSDGRTAARVIHQALTDAANAHDDGEYDPNKLRDIMRRVLHDEPKAQVDYISIADPVTLAELREPTNTSMLVSLTVQIGQPRLLDNMLLPAHLNTVEGLTATLGAV